MRPEIEQDLSCPQCGGRAEPEQDGDLTYFVCTDEFGADCSAEFGYQRVPPNEPVCPAGLPLSVVASAPQAGEDRTVFLGPAIPRRPDD